MASKKKGSSRKTGKRISATGKKAVTKLKKDTAERIQRRKLLQRVGIAVGAVALLGALIFLVIALLPKTALIVSYGLDPKETQALRELSEAWAEQSGSKAFKLQEAAANRNLEYYLGRKSGIALVCMRPGLEAHKAKALCMPIPESLASPVSLSLRVPALGEAGNFALPLSVGHYELSYDVGLFADRKLRAPASLKELETAAATFKKTGLLPVLAAGGQDESLLAFVSYLVAGPYGLGPYEKLCAALASGTSFAEVLDLELGDAEEDQSLTLRQTLTRLDAWRKAGWLSPTWFNDDIDSVGGMAKNGAAPIFLAFLSDRRDFDARALERYKALRFPAFSGQSSSSVLGPMLAIAIPVSSSGKRSSKAALSFLSFCMSDDGQRILQNASGNGPTVAAAEATDLQASDARQWAIMSERILQGLAWDGFSDRAKAATFADDLRAWLIREAGR